MQMVMTRAYKYLTDQAEMDIEKVLESVFSGRVGFVGLPAQVSDTFFLRMRLIGNGHLPSEFEPLLCQVLSEQLQMAKRFAQVWINPEADTEELAETWMAIVEAHQRWLAFISYPEEPIDLNALHAAYRYAYERCSIEKTTFKTPEERDLWKTLLKNEQMRELQLGKILEASESESQYQLEGCNFLYKGASFRLKPNLAEILKVLLDGEAHTATALIRLVFGSRTVSSENRNKLSKRISELNKVLQEIMGKPEKSRWINKYPYPNDLAYRFHKEAQTVENAVA